jgi:predicted Ser/Thr protein kinase
MDNFKKISMKKTKNGLEIKNPTNYELIGKGVQGAVFRISDDRCIKVYARERHWLRECEALNAGQDSSIVPKVFEVGENYIVMEYIKGQPLKEYLRSIGTIPEPIAKKLVFIFKEMKRIGFTRIDAAIRHFIVTDDGEIKVVDHVNSMKRLQAWPIKLFESLARLNLLDLFLDYLKEIDPDLYREWQNLIKNSKDK